MKQCDTDRILDDCQCGERPFIQHYPNSWQALCDSCGESTMEHDNSTDMMIQWNKMQRGIANGN